MKQEEKKVAHKGKVVSTITVPIYESLAEAIADNGAGAEGEAFVLATFNKQNVIRLQAVERNKFSESPTGKKARREIAFSLMCNLPNAAEIVSGFGGNMAAMEAYLTSADMEAKVDEVLAERAKADAATAA